jgi:hypothetical protein
MKLFALVALAGIAAVANADVITQWDFNGTAGTTTPNVGSGTASLVGGTTATFANGNANGGSTDPNTSASNFGWNITTFAAQGQDSGNRGVQFLVSTLGYTNIIVTFDQRHSNTSSRFYAGQYTVDGTNWVTATTFEGNAGDTWFNGRTIDLSAVSAANNNANFGVRVVAVFATGTNAYTASTSTSTYAATGTARFDMVTVNGDVIPTPGAVALAGFGGLLAARRRR